MGTHPGMAGTRQLGRRRGAASGPWGASPAGVGHVGAGSEADGSGGSAGPPGSSCLPPSHPPAAWGAGPPGRGAASPRGSDTLRSQNHSDAQSLTVTQRGETRDNDSESPWQVPNIWDNGAFWLVIGAFLLAVDDFIKGFCSCYVQLVIQCFRRWSLRCSRENERVVLRLAAARARRDQRVLSQKHLIQNSTIICSFSWLSPRPLSPSWNLEREKFWLRKILKDSQLLFPSNQPIIAQCSQISQTILLKHEVFLELHNDLIANSTNFRPHQQFMRRLKWIRCFALIGNSSNPRCVIS